MKASNFREKKMLFHFYVDTLPRIFFLKSSNQSSHISYAEAVVEMHGFCSFLFSQENYFVSTVQKKL